MIAHIRRSANVIEVAMTAGVSYDQYLLGGGAAMCGLAGVTSTAWLVLLILYLTQRRKAVAWNLTPELVGNQNSIAPAPATISPQTPDYAPPSNTRDGGGMCGQCGASIQAPFCTTCGTSVYQSKEIG
jgi:hypothetical protein